MSCPFGTISKRAWLEVRLEDRLQYKRERTLHHPVPDGRNREGADFAPILRNILLPGGERTIGATNEFAPNLLEETRQADRRF
jgi:hypothetical protein